VGSLYDLSSRAMYRYEETGITIIRLMRDLKCIIVLVCFKSGQCLIMSESQWELLFATIKDELRDSY